MAATNNTQHEVTITDTAYDQLDAITGTIRNAVFEFAKFRAEQRKNEEGQQEIAIDERDIEEARRWMPQAIEYALNSVTDIREDKKEEFYKLAHQLKNQLTTVKY